MRQAIADRGLPLIAAEAAEAVAAPLSATAWEPAGDLQVLGGVQGTDWRYTAGNVQVNGANYGTTNVLEILSSTPLTVKNADGKATSATTIQVNAGVKADLTLAGVNIISGTAAPINMVTNSDEDGDSVKVKNGADIKNKTMLYLTLADGTDNALSCTDSTTSGSPALRCGWGSVLIIDDERANVRSGGSKFNLPDIVVPANGAVGSGTTLLDGTVLKSGDPLEKL